jgi:tetratricopeptide (TPR) repeat protein
LPQANSSFISEKYADAIRDYESLISQGRVSSSLFYNLANAYFREGKVGSAIANYEKALWLDPNDADIKANLQFARRNAGLFEASVSWWEVAPRFLTLNAWTILSDCLFALVCGLLILRMFQRRWNLRPILFFALLGWMMTVAAVAIRSGDLNRGIILNPETPLRIAPLEESVAASNLAAGSVVEIQKRREAFYFVRAQDGKEGWVKDSQAQRVVPE